MAPFPTPTPPFNQPIQELLQETVGDGIDTIPTVEMEKPLGDECCADLRTGLANLDTYSQNYYDGKDGVIMSSVFDHINFDEGIENSSCETLVDALNGAIGYGEFLLQGGNAGPPINMNAQFRHEMELLNRLRQLKEDYEACTGQGWGGAEGPEDMSFYASADTPFDQAFALLKYNENDNTDFLAHLKAKELFGMQRLGDIFADNDNPNLQEHYKNIIIEQLLDPTNQYSLTDAETPTVFRSIPTQQYQREKPHGFSPGRFFSPQRLTAEQYAAYQKMNRRGVSEVHQYEMPVGFDDKSVLQVPTNKHGLNIVGGEFSIDSPEVKRIADENNMSLEDAKKAIEAWHSVYMGFVPHGTMKDIAGPMQEAGYDYITWPETASAAYYPPIAASAFGAIDWGAKHEAHWAREEPQKIDDWWDPTRKVLMERLGIPHRDKSGAMGKHSGFPQWSAWHIGDEDSAPEYIQNEGIPTNLPHKYLTSDYHNFQNAARIAAAKGRLSDR